MKLKLMHRNKLMTSVGFGLFALVIGSIAAQSSPSSRQRITVVFCGGFETDRQDEGRPVKLVASALGVPSQVFRNAFSHVHPARGGEPQAGQVRLNKDALLSALEPFGITNDRLDEVSDYYRYRQDRGEMWRRTPASGYAIVSNHKIVGFKITDPGSGYSSVPTVTIPGFGRVETTVSVSYSTKLESNGSISGISLKLPTLRH